MNRYLVAIATLCSAIITEDGRAKLVPEPRSYHPFDMFDNGYKEKLQSDGTWRIVGPSRVHIDGFGFANDMALYRAAELASSSGHKYFQILNSTAMTKLIGGNPFRETVIIVVRPVDTDNAPIECQSKRVDVCNTLDAENIIARIGPTLHK